MADTIEEDVKELEENKPEGSDTEDNKEQDNSNNPVVVVENNNSDGEEHHHEVPQLHGFRGRLAEKYKDCGEDFNDDAVFEKYCNKCFDDQENELKGYHQANNVLTDIFEVYPEFQDMIQDIAIRKMNPRVAIARQFSLEDLTPNADEEDFGAWTKEYNERKERNAKQREFEETLKKNMGESNGIIDTFCKDKSLTDEQKKTLIETMDSLLDEAFCGKISPRLLDMIAKALNYEKAVEMAKAVGEIAGRNANIEAKLESETKKHKGDGLPSSGSNGGYKPNMISGTKAVIDFSKYM